MLSIIILNTQKKISWGRYYLHFICDEMKLGKSRGKRSKENLNPCFLDSETLS